MNKIFKSQTTFVIGAGASLELGFPTSHQLKAQIAQALDIGFEFGSRQVKGDRAIGRELNKFANAHSEEGNQEYNNHLAAGRHISKAMPQAISIDNFVEAQESERITRMAKLGIASCLITAEQESWSKMRTDEHSDAVRWPKLENTWIHRFFQTLTEGLKKANLIIFFRI